MTREFLNGLVALSVLTVSFALSPAIAEEKRELKYSFNLGITTDYVFRGFSQTAREATGQGGVDITWGTLYVGAWASGVDFGKEGTRDVARGELDIYAGIKPVWNGFNFDFGGIYYVYPGAKDKATTITGELDYFEFKAGVSRGLWKGATLTSTLFLSPDYTNSTGRVITTETGFAQELPSHGGITPTISALLGYQGGRDARFINLVGNGDKSYLYWNVGLTLGWEKFSLDLRYWDTDIKNNNLAGGFANGFCTGTTFQCDERFMATFKFTY